MSKIEITDNKIQKINIFRQSELFIDEIAGFRVSRDSMEILELVSNNPNKKNLRIYLMFKNNDDLINWLNKNSSDLEKCEYESEIKSINKLTSEDKVKLNKARKWAKAINISGYVISLLALFYPNSYNITISLLIIFPFISLLSIGYFNGLIKFDFSVNSQYPDVTQSFIVCYISLLVRSYLDWNIMSWETFWMPYFIINIITIISCFSFCKYIRANRSSFIVLIICGMFFCYGATISINGIYDKSKPTIIKTKIVNKRISAGKTRTYYLTLEGSGEFHFNRESIVSWQQFEACKLGDIVNVRVYKGALGIPFYSIGKN
jgi:hypothetical protein